SCEASTAVLERLAHDTRKDHIMSTINRKLTMLASLISVASLLMAVTARSAFALSTTATVTAVKVYIADGNDPNGQGLTLQITSTGQNPWTQITPQTLCKTVTNVSADTIKGWQSLAEAALLSGKQAKIDSVVCNTVPYITGITLMQ